MRDIKVCAQFPHGKVILRLFFVFMCLHVVAKTKGKGSVMFKTNAKEVCVMVIFPAAAVLVINILFLLTP